MSLREPPPQFNGNLQDWSRRLVDYLNRLQQEQDNGALQAVRLRHLIADRDKAFQDGVLMFQPGFERMVFSQNGQWRRVPSSVMNETISASKWTFVNAIEAPNVPNLVKQSTDGVVNNDTTFQSSQLTFPVDANTFYSFRGVVFIDTGATADFKFRITGPASPGLLRIRTASIAAGATAFGNIRVETAFGTSRAVAGTGTTGGYVEFEGLLNNGANAGNVAFEWGQNALEVTNTILRAGSYMEWVKL